MLCRASINADRSPPCHKLHDILLPPPRTCFLPRGVNSTVHVHLHAHIVLQLFGRFPNPINQKVLEEAVWRAFDVGLNGLPSIVYLDPDVAVEPTSAQLRYNKHKLPCHVCLENANEDCCFSDFLIYGWSIYRAVLGTCIDYPKRFNEHPQVPTQPNVCTKTILGMHPCIPGVHTWMRSWKYSFVECVQAWVVWAYENHNNLKQSPWSVGSKGSHRVRWPSWQGVGLIPRIAWVRAPTWVGTASTIDLFNDHADWRVVFDQQVIMPIAYGSHYAAWWFKSIVYIMESLFYSFPLLFWILGCDTSESTQPV